MNDAPAHVWLRPRLIALIAEAEQAGIARDVAVAVAIDLMTGPDFNPTVAIAEPARGRAVVGGYQDTSVTED